MSDAQSFWARRRAGVEAEAKAEQAVLDAETLQEEQAHLEGMSDSEILEALELPEPETLKIGDDFSAFMGKAVPEHLRRRALRTLWRSNPVLANVDMLVDYGEDFTDAALAVENIQTAYQVGKGMLKHVEEMARQAAELEEPALEEVPEEEQEVVVSLVEEPEVTPAQEPPAKVALGTEETNEDDGWVSPIPRRMQFRREETA